MAALVIFGPRLPGLTGRAASRNPRHSYVRLKRTCQIVMALGGRETVVAKDGRGHADMLGIMDGDGCRNAIAKQMRIDRPAERHSCAVRKLELQRMGGLGSVPVAQPQLVASVPSSCQQAPIVVQVSLELRQERLRKWNLQRCVVLGFVTGECKPPLAIPLQQVSANADAREVAFAKARNASRAICRPSRK